MESLYSGDTGTDKRGGNLIKGGGNLIKGGGGGEVLLMLIHELLFGIYPTVLISGCWNREVPLYTEVFSLQGVGIERFHCIQRCSHFRGLE